MGTIIPAVCAAQGQILKEQVRTPASRSSGIISEARRADDASWRKYNDLDRIVTGKRTPVVTATNS